MPNAPFPIQADLTAIALAWRNEALIADEVLPRTSVGKQEFKYTEYPLAECFTIPDTRVGRKSPPNEVSFSGTEQTASTKDYGLEDPIPQDDIANAAPGDNPVGKSVEGLTNLIGLDREVRVANLVFATGTYGANTRTIEAAEQFGTAETSDPIKTIWEALDLCVMRPNVMVIGQPAWTVLARHPEIIKAVNANSGDAGIARREAVAQLFELDRVLVGQAWVNTAKKGKAATLARAWGKHIALLHQNRTANARQGVTFGLTFQWQAKVAGSRPDPNIGLRGGVRVRVGESVLEKVIAPTAGYLLANVVG